MALLYTGCAKSLLAQSSTSTALKPLPSVCCLQTHTHRQLCILNSKLCVHILVNIHLFIHYILWVHWPYPLQHTNQKNSRLHKFCGQQNSLLESAEWLKIPKLHQTHTKVLVCKNGHPVGCPSHGSEQKKGGALILMACLVLCSQEPMCMLLCMHWNCPITCESFSAIASKCGCSYEAVRKMPQTQAGIMRDYCTLFLFQIHHQPPVIGQNGSGPAYSFTLSQSQCVAILLVCPSKKACVLVSRSGTASQIPICTQAKEAPSFHVVVGKTKCDKCLKTFFCTFGFFNVRGITFTKSSNIACRRFHSSCR